MKQQHFTEMDV